MGIHGLTTYLRENKHVFSRSLNLSKPLSSGQNPQPVPLVVDAWSFIYEIVHCADLPWVYGGEYPRFAGLIEHVVRAWIDVGLELHFVFDGPYPALKFPTLVSRITQNSIKSGLLFFRTSPTARAAPRFLRETAILPPLAYSTCVDTLVRIISQLESEYSQVRKEAHLLSSPLNVHFADQEGDPYAVALAGRLGAFVAGRDSDFVVLNAEGYQGYVPLDEMLWTLSSTPSVPWDGEGSVYSAADTDASSAWGEGDVDEDGFQIVRKGKSKNKRAAPTDQNVKAGRGILPPDALDPADTDGQLTLSFAVYDPSAIASHLGIPVSLLPLLGALLGNDFTGAGSDDSNPPPATTAEIKSKAKANLQRLFFERGLTHAQRITRVATTLSGILAAAFSGGAGGKRGKKQIGSVMELIDAAVTALLVRPLDTFATGEKEAIVERIAEATLQYAIPKAGDADFELDADAERRLTWVSNTCPLHTPETCPLVSNLSRLVTEHSAVLDARVGVGEYPEPEAYAEKLEKVRDLYVDAYRRGRLDPHILDALQTGTTWPRSFLEDPDKESVQRSVGRPIRMWTYAVLDSGVGLPSAPEPDDEQQDEDEGDEDDDDDELVDVVEEDEDEDEDGDGDVAPQDPLARLRGALKELDGSDNEEATDHSPHITASASPRRPKIVTEYVRRGTRLVPEEIAVSPFPEIVTELSLGEDDSQVPPQLWPEGLRKTALLRALASDRPSVAGLSAESLMGVLTVRWVVRSMHLRSKENPGVKERLAERWTEAEAKAVLASMLAQDSRDSTETEGETREAVAVVERHVQLVAQTLAALDAIEQLAQVLLLSPTIESPTRWLSGTTCHAILNGRIPLAAVEPGADIWRACVDGLEDAFAPAMQKKKDKRAKAQAAAAAAVAAAQKPGGKGKSGGGRGGMFGMLGDMDA